MTGNNEVPNLATSQVRYQDASGLRSERDTDNVARRAGYIQIRGGPATAHNRIDSLLDEEAVKTKLINLPRDGRLTQTRQFDQRAPRKRRL